MERTVVHGALGHMAGAGLLRERPRGSFMREHIRRPNSKPTIMEEAMATAESKTILAGTTSLTITTPQAKTDPLDLLGLLAARVATKARELDELASEISDTIIEVQAQQEQSSEELKKLRQLKQLLQGL